jgi:hypothetical protein
MRNAMIWKEGNPFYFSPDNPRILFEAREGREHAHPRRYRQIFGYLWKTLLIVEDGNTGMHSAISMPN